MQRLLEIDIDTANQQDGLNSALQALESQAESRGVEALDLAGLNYLACGSCLARHLLDVAHGGRHSLSVLGDAHPTASEDAGIVYSSTLEAIDQVGQVLRHVSDWVSLPEWDRDRAVDGIRHLFHSLSNLLVSINCYAELLLLELPNDSLAYTPVKALSTSSSQASRVARDRSVMQRLINEREELSGLDRMAKDREILSLLINTLCANATYTPNAPWQRDRQILGTVAERLPVLESRLLLEAVRRYECVAA